jgi:hypothetical protein
MNWPFVNTLTLWQWGLLALIPPAILALYFLKLRRQPLAVPSTYLWSKAIEDLHVNSLWQRLRQSLLLFLQLLLIALLAFILLRPGWRGTELSGDRFIFLIDTSASMSATDIAPTRLDEAKRQARALVDQMKTGDVAMLISFSNSARVEQPFTDNRRLLRQKIDVIEQTNHTSDLSEALRAASGLANPGQSGDHNTKRSRATHSRMSQSPLSARKPTPTSPISCRPSGGSRTLAQNLKRSKPRCCSTTYCSTPKASSCRSAASRDCPAWPASSSTCSSWSRVS